MESHVADGNAEVGQERQAEELPRHHGAVVPEAGSLAEGNAEIGDQRERDQEGRVDAVWGLGVQGNNYFAEM